MKNPMDLSGKNILVTGASSGIGKGIAIYLSKVGANIIMAARNEGKLKETFNELEPGNHSYYLIDLNNLDEIEDMIDNICSDGRKLNGIVHSAGISSTIPIQYIKLDNLKSIMSVNFYSFIELVKHFSKRKYNDNGGSIVAISSISSKVGARGLAAYCASKGALDSSIRPIALELAAKNIRINSIAPGMIKSQIYDGLIELVNNKDFETDLKKRQILGLGKPEDVASVAAFLLSDASKFITGTSITVDGGYLAH
ncbi:SDR family NAD(P)-dependent oxidoreductase [Ruminiclostridium papyrosolvens]|uniref:Short-chain dehydrogenase n=1 Tax=Ruminiclostridium papyrosolvens C7 TaxID=1330534 RepID=U4R4W3_9FIRM|nr:SDR family oxidoreductase [Ruminiclostridium papyrosolvens]EPR13625.1 short-chain dehydrogenase [Ruminiclostridium papyrosolvens C7]